MSGDPESLRALLGAYYPPGMDAEDPRYRGTEEAQRLRALMDGMARAMGAVDRLCVGLGPVPDEVLRLGATVAAFGEWGGFLRRLAGAFPGCAVGDQTIPWYDPSFSARISWPSEAYGAPARDGVVGVLGLLAPVYAIFGERRAGEGEYWLRFSPLPGELQEREARLARLIEEEFGFTRLDEAILMAPVPDLVPPHGNTMLGEARLVDCLLTTERPPSP